MSTVVDTEWQSVPLAERPFARELAEHRVWIVLFLRATALQGMHPVVAQGIVDHSRIWSDPTSRIPETMRYGQMMYLGEAVPTTAAEIRELHRDIGGTLDDGTKYHAWGREAWTWVHLTAIESLLFSLEACFGPLDPDDAELLYQQGRRAGLLYGIRDEDMPKDVAGLGAFIEDRLPAFEPTNATEQLKAFVLEQLGLFVPGPRVISAPLSRVLAPWLRALAFGTFPPVMREKWGVTWTRRHEWQYRAVLRALRLASVLPDRVRMAPTGYALLHPSS